MEDKHIYTAISVEAATNAVKIINTLMEPYHKDPSALKKGKHTYAKFEFRKDENVDDVITTVRKIVGQYGYELNIACTEQGFGIVEVILGLVVKYNLSIILNLKSNGQLISHNKIKEDKQMTETVVPQTLKQPDTNAAKDKQPSNEAATNKQVGGSHYQLPIQPIEYILANGLGYCEANVVKYVSRWRNKGGIQDLKKAIHYLEMLIEQEEKDASKKS